MALEAGAVSDTLRWRSLPLVDDYPRSLVLIATVAAVCTGAHFAFGGVVYALLAAAFLAVSLRSYFLPTWVELDEAGVRLRFLGRTRAVAWDEVRRVDVHREGVHLSPFPEPSRLDSFRGTFVRFAGNAEEVERFVRRKVATAP